MHFSCISNTYTVIAIDTRNTKDVVLKVVPSPSPLYYIEKNEVLMFRCQVTFFKLC